MSYVPGHGLSIGWLVDSPSKDISSSTLEFLSDEKVAEVVRMGVNAKEQLCAFAKSFLQCRQALVDAEKTCPAFAFIWESVCCKPWQKLSSCLEKFSLALLHLFCEQVPHGVSSDPCDQDVLYFTQYAGPDLFEKNVKRWFTDEDLWYDTEISEMVRLGAAALLHGDKVMELSKMLDAPVLSTPFLNQVAEILKTVREVTRSQRLAGIMQRFKEPGMN